MTQPTPRGKRVFSLQPEGRARLEERGSENIRSRPGRTPGAAIAFNTRPEDTADAAARQLNAR
jgi:hypothetical protein